MTDQPYTDTDLRAEAALARDALMHLPTTEEIVTSLRGAYVSSLHADGDEATWGNLLDEEGLTEAARRIGELMVPAAPVGQWAVDLGADGLEPSPHVLNLDGDDKPVVRIHMAFDPDMPERDRQCFGMALAQVMANSL